MKDDRNGVLVFTGLFAAVVPPFIIESYQQLQPVSGDITTALLTQIFQQIAVVSNGMQYAIPSQSPDAAFRPSSSAIRVNILWFICLLLSVTCALITKLCSSGHADTCQKQSAQRAGPLQRQGRVRAYLFMGLHTFHMKSVLEALSAIIHASVILFFAGLVEFLFTINTSVAYVILAFVVAVASLYLGITLFPFQYPNSPYATPLSSFGTLIKSSARTGLSKLSRMLYKWNETWIEKRDGLRARAHDDGSSPREREDLPHHSRTRFIGMRLSHRPANEPWRRTEIQPNVHPASAVVPPVPEGARIAPHHFVFGSCFLLLARAFA